MKKILYVTTTIKKEGPGNVLGNLLENIDRTKYDPTIITIQGTGDWTNRYRELEIPVINLGMRTPVDFLSTLPVYRRIRKLKPDLVHTQLLTADIFGRLAAWLARTPFVTTVHNMDDWKRSKKPIPFAASFVDGVGLKNTKGVIAVSEAVKQDTMERQGVKADKITVIRNAIDLDKFGEPLDSTKQLMLKKSLNIPRDAVVVGTTARIMYQKAPEVWLETVRKILLKYPDTHFIWAGTGPLEKQIRALAIKNNLINNVHFVGQRDDVPELLKIFDIYTLVSRWEGLPLALVEAMCAGNACIASNVSGNPEVIKTGQTGLLVPSEDVTAFCEALEKLITDTTLRKQLGQAAQQDVQQKFGLARMVREYQDFYQKIFSELA